MGVGTILKRTLPRPVLHHLQYWQHRLRRAPAARGGAAGAFTAVYATKAWGDDGTAFHSGPGTIEHAVTRPYLDLLAADFARLPSPPRVLDLGCGDFKLGRHIAPLTSGYTGVDIVPALIVHNTLQYGSDTVRFLCADATEDDLPPADVVLVREVMQHMSNAQVSRLLARLKNYPMVYVTNIEPPKDAVDVMNRDLVPGPDTRGVFGSALFVDEPPFSFGGEIVLSVPTHQPHEAPLAMTTRRRIR